MQKRYPYNFWKDINNVKKVLYQSVKNSVVVEVTSTTYADIIEEILVVVIYTPICTP